MHHSLAGVFALREGSWKFVPSRGSGGFSSPKTVKTAPEQSDTQLYHLAEDPSETRNLSTTETARVAAMKTRLSAIQSSERTR